MAVPLPIRQSGQGCKSFASPQLYCAVRIDAYPTVLLFSATQFIIATHSEILHFEFCILHLQNQREAFLNFEFCILNFAFVQSTRGVPQPAPDPWQLTTSFRISHFAFRIIYIQRAAFRNLPFAICNLQFATCTINARRSSTGT